MYVCVYTQMLTHTHPKFRLGRRNYVGHECRAYDCAPFTKDTEWDSFPNVFRFLRSGI